MKKSGLIVSALLLSAGGAFSASGQSIWVQVEESKTSEPLPGVLVKLLSLDNVALSTVITGRSGSARFERVPEGNYRLKAEMIGHETTLSELVDVSKQDVSLVQMSLPVKAIDIEGIAVEVDRRCRLRPDDGEALAELWGEARKALEFTKWTSEHPERTYEIEDFSRELEPANLLVREETRSSRRLARRNPIVSLSANLLATDGFIQEAENGSYDYFAPDPEVLLSNVFLDTHCFFFDQSLPPRKGQVGLSFRPTGHHDRPDIRGVMWLENGTFRLRTLEFQYENTPFQIGDPRIGGKVEFKELPEGGWVVESWVIRMPVVGRMNSGGRWGRQDDVLLSLIEEGAALSVVPAGPQGHSSRAVRQTIFGFVFDSLNMRPASGAKLSLVGTGRTAIADANGQFEMPEVPAGRYRIVVEDPMFRLAGLSPPSAQVGLPSQRPVTVILATPAPHSLLRDVCGMEASDAPFGLLGGTVSTEEGVRIPFGLFKMEWSSWELQSHGYSAAPISTGKGIAVKGGERVVTREEREIWEIMTGENGEFVVCGLPLGIPIRVLGERLTGESMMEVRLSEESPVNLGLTVIGVSPPVR